MAKGVQMGKDVIIACDFPDKKTTLQFLDHFSDVQLYVKIGMELFYAEGPNIVREIKDRGHKIFLDLKLHDIPNTVKSAMKRLSCLDIDMCNVHAAGGSFMMKAAAEGLRRIDGTSPLLIAVTQLTSTSQEMLEDELLINHPLNDVVAHYAALAQQSGLRGIVCSPHEVPKVKEQLGSQFLCITPGVRLKSNSKDDQHRITTPADAKELGSDYIVVGRPITQAEDPRAAYNIFIKDFKK